jgi:hypothetical protein
MAAEADIENQCLPKQTLKLNPLHPGSLRYAESNQTGSGLFHSIVKEQIIPGQLEGLQTNPHPTESIDSCQSAFSRKKRRCGFLSETNKHGPEMKARRITRRAFHPYWLAFRRTAGVSMAIVLSLRVTPAPIFLLLSRRQRSILHVRPMRHRDPLAVVHDLAAVPGMIVAVVSVVNPHVLGAAAQHHRSGHCYRQQQQC